MGILCAQGVGPATASAVLTAGDPNFPYMADEAMDVSLDKQREYTVKRYVEFAAIVRQKAAELSAQGKASLQNPLSLMLAVVHPQKLVHP